MGRGWCDLDKLEKRLWSFCVSCLERDVIDEHECDGDVSVYPQLVPSVLKTFMGLNGR